MKRGPLLVALLLLLALLGIGAALFSVSFKQEWSTRWVPDRDEAISNPFLALEIGLKSMGIAASDHEDLPVVLPRLRPGDTLVLVGDVTTVSSSQARQIVTWIQSGGHLLFQAPPNPGNAPLLVILPLPDQLPEGSPLVRAHIGTNGGTATMTQDLNILTRHELADADTQHLVWRMLAPGLPPATPLARHAHVWLILSPEDTSDDGAFWPWLVQHFWPALVASLLLMLGWAWAKSQRLGPMIPPPPPHRRALLDHISAAGAMFYRRDHGRTLHRLAVEATHLRRKHRFGDIPEAALSPPANPAAFRVAIANLARLWSP